MKIREFGAIPAHDIKMLESRYSIELPKDYTNFLSSMGGGEVEKTNNLIFVQGLSDSISIDVLYGVNTQYENANMTMWTDKYFHEMPESTLIIGDTLEHGFVVLLCSGNDAGIYYWDDTYHYACSNDNNNTFFIADTFEDFLRMAHS